MWVLALAGIAVWLFLGFVGVHLLQNNAIVPTWFVIGAFLVPGLILLTMVRRLRPSEGVIPSLLVRAFVFGGLASIVIGSTLDSLLGTVDGSTATSDSVVSLASAGIIEEAAKIVAVLVVARGLTVKSVRSGLFLGGAVGLGFAAFEDSGYAYKFFVSGDGHEVGLTALTAVFRALSTPFGHPLWTSLFAAAVFAAAARSNRFRLTWGVIGAYLAVSLAHGMWDGASDVFVTWLGPTTGALVSTVLVVAVVVTTVLIWRHVVRSTQPALTAAVGERKPAPVP